MMQWPIQPKKDREEVVRKLKENSHLRVFHSFYGHSFGLNQTRKFFVVSTERQIKRFFFQTIS